MRWPLVVLEGSRSLFGAAPIVLALAGCATIPVRSYSDAELTTTTRRCGLSPGDVVQEAEEPRLLFLYRPDPSRRQFDCARKWAVKRGLRLVFIKGVTWK